MDGTINELADRFEKSLFLLMQNLGPQLVTKLQLGLTPGQVYMLYFLREQNGCKVSALAEKLEVNVSAATIMLDRLEAQGFIIRTRDDDDRRVVRIEITPRGEDKLREILSARQRIIKRCFRQMDPEELVSFVGALGDLSTIASTIDIAATIGSNDEEE